MEVDGFLEELLGLRKETWESTFPTEMNEFFSQGWNFSSYNENPSFILPNPSFQGVDHHLLNQPDFNCSLNEVNSAFEDGFFVPEINSPTFPTPLEDHNPLVQLKNEDGYHNLEETKASFKVEPVQASDVPVPDPDMGLCIGQRKNRVKKVEGQPSKNLMAERRRRKRLNDRLSMLRSVVPKISKMDRTSILGDTIDYMKELLERIKNLRGETEAASDQFNLMDILMDFKPKEVLVRNTPKFIVERKDIDTRIDISCAGKQGLLLSTLTTLDVLGLELQQCVISCFNDFSMQASCSEELEQRTVTSAEEIKQSLFRNAGYGGRFM